VCERVFLNECRLLLQLVANDESSVACMLKDPGHSQWNSRALNDQLNQCLSDTYGSCKDIVEDICAILDGVDKILKSFEEIAAKKKKVCSKVDNRTVPTQKQHYSDTAGLNHST
jgi:hypothetical protein